MTDQASASEIVQVEGHPGSAPVIRVSMHHL
jgi:hypothetical protein